MSKVAFHTLGCKVNQYETEAMMAQFESIGYDIVAFNEKSDVYLVNTCTVTNMADKKSRQMLAKAKKQNPKSLVVAVGCYVQAAKETLEKATNIDLLIGNTDKGHIAEIVEKYLEEKVIPDIEDLSKYRLYDELWLSHKHGHTRAHIKIQDGCDQFCTYCIIPFTRGRIRSREADSIISEVKELVQQGYKEIVLTGIHLASYGVQFDGYKLIDLMSELNDIKGLRRIRLGSLEPTLITEDFVKRLSSLTKVCPHFHLSMQSGNDEVLKAMNRKYTTDEFYEAVMKLRSYFSECAITTDLIVGFPGESDEQFDKTLEFLKTVKFYDVHVFKYSKRDGTKAAAMSGQIDGNVKNKRSHEAMALVKNMKHLYIQGFIGRDVEVLLEDDEMIDGVRYHVGHTRNYLKVYTQIDAAYSKPIFMTVKGMEPMKDGLLAN